MLEYIIIPAVDLDRDVASILHYADPFAGSFARHTFCGLANVSGAMPLASVRGCLELEERARALREWCTVGTSIETPAVSVDDGWTL